MNNKIPFSPSRLDSTIFFKKKLESILKGNKTIIDVGCGKLFFYELLKDIKFSGSYLGIDINPMQSIKEINFKSKILKKNFLKYKTSKTFDIAACLWVIEHIKNDELVIKKIFDLLKKNGFLIIAVPSVYSWPFEFGKHGYKYYSLSEIKNILTNTGFKIIQTHEAGGLLGFMFMIIYNWIRYVILVPSLWLFLILNRFNFIKSNWSKFSKNIISNTIYFYHRYEKLVLIHNKLIKTILKIDKITKILPASYILVVKK